MKIRKKMTLDNEKQKIDRARRKITKLNVEDDVSSIVIPFIPPGISIALTMAIVLFRKRKRQEMRKDNENFTRDYRAGKFSEKNMIKDFINNEFKKTFQALGDIKEVGDSQELTRDWLKEANRVSSFDQLKAWAKQGERNQAAKLLVGINKMIDDRKEAIMRAKSLGIYDKRLDKRITRDSITRRMRRDFLVETLVVLGTVGAFSLWNKFQAAKKKKAFVEGVKTGKITEAMVVQQAAKWICDAIENDLPSASSSSSPDEEKKILEILSEYREFRKKAFSARTFAELKQLSNRYLKSPKLNKYLTEMNYEVDDWIDWGKEGIRAEEERFKKAGGRVSGLAAHDSMPRSSNIRKSNKRIKCRNDAIHPLLVAAIPTALYFAARAVIKEIADRSFEHKVKTGQITEKQLVDRVSNRMTAWMSENLDLNDNESRRNFEQFKQKVRSAKTFDELLSMFRSSGYKIDLYPLENVIRAYKKLMAKNRTDAKRLQMKKGLITHDSLPWSRIKK